LRIYTSRAGGGHGPVRATLADGSLASRAPRPSPLDARAIPAYLGPGPVAALGKDTTATIDPPRRQLRGEPTWKGQAMLSVLLVCIHHLRATSPGPLARTDLDRLVTARTFPALMDLLDASPDAAVRREGHVLRATFAVAGAWTRGRVMAGLPAALTNPLFRLDLARAAARAGLDLFPSAR